MKIEIRGKLFKGIRLKAVGKDKERILLEYIPSMPVKISADEQLQLEVMV